MVHSSYIAQSSNTRHELDRQEHRFESCTLFFLLNTPMWLNLQRVKPKP